MLRRTGPVALGIGLVLAVADPSSAQGPATPTEVAPDAATRWYRVFLTDGSSVSCVGPFTRVDDVVVLQVPTSPSSSDTRAVSIAAAGVDWPKTEAYRDAMQRALFEQTSGARAYAAFTEEVAATVRDVALLPDPLERIAHLEAARARLAAWPSAHHGYRAADVAETLSVVDDLLNGMRAAAGQQAFSLALTTSSMAPSPPRTEVLPSPTLQELVAQALGLSRHVSDPAERLLLLQSAEKLLSASDAPTAAWVKGARRDVQRGLTHEARVTSRYARLRTWMLERTTRLLAAADVRGLLRLRDDVVKRDARLDRQRPAEVASLLATLDARLETARRHRLLLDRWTERRGVLTAYAQRVTPYLGESSPLARALEDVRALSGPDPAVLGRAEAELVVAQGAAVGLPVPDEARTADGLWASARQLADRALQTRRAAIRTGDLQQAWEASAAAAGALMLIRQLRTDVPALLAPPTLPGTAGH